MLTPRFDQIPQALRDVPRWVCWRHEARKAGEGGTKIPFDARTGRRASSTDPATW